MAGNEREIKKQLIGLYGESELATKLHRLGWQVYRAYIDELIDFVISRYYCTKCKQFTELYIRETKNYTSKQSSEPKDVQCRTNLCAKCKEDKVKLVTKFIQVKSSAGNKEQKFSFHPRLSYLIEDLYCVWIFLRDIGIEEINKPIRCDFFIFKGLEIADIEKDIGIDSYQKTDNQKIDLKIDDKGNIKGKGAWTYLNNKKSFEILEEQSSCRTNTSSPRQNKKNDM